MHEGWHPYEATNANGVKIRVMEYHTLPKNKIHDADIAEQAISTGKTHSQILRDLAGGKDTDILVGGLSVSQAPEAPIKGASRKELEGLATTTMRPGVAGGEAWDTETYTGRARGHKKAAEISEALRNSAVTAPLASDNRVNVRQLGQEATVEGTRELTEAEKAGKKSVQGPDDSRLLVSSAKAVGSKEVSPLRSGVLQPPKGQQWSEVKPKSATRQDIASALAGGHITEDEAKEYGTPASESEFK